MITSTLKQNHPYKSLKIADGLEQVLDLLGANRNIVLRSVVVEAVLEDQLHIAHKFLLVPVSVVGELGENRAEIHWLLDDLVVVVDPEDLLVDWLFEVLAAFVLQASSYHLYRLFLPVVDKSIGGLNGLRVQQERSKVRELL